MIPDAGIVYACGNSKYGKLCINDNIESNVTKPVKINFQFSTLKVNRASTYLQFLLITIIRIR